jgi:hypothetical protein
MRLHKNGANRIIALKFGGLVVDFRFFPQAFPLLCAKLNALEIFFLARGPESCTQANKIIPMPTFDRRKTPMLE